MAEARLLGARGKWAARVRGARPEVRVQPLAQDLRKARTCEVRKTAIACHIRVSFAGGK